MNYSREYSNKSGSGKGVGREWERSGKKGKEGGKLSEGGFGTEKRVNLHNAGKGGRMWDGKNAQSEKILEKALTNPL